MVLELDISIPRLAPHLTAAVIRIFVDNAQVGSARISGRTLVRCRVPAQELRPDGPIDIRLEHPCAARLDLFGDSKEDRTLGLCVYGLALFHASLARLGTKALSSPPDIQRLIVEAPPAPVEQPAFGAATYVLGRDAPDRDRLKRGWYFDADGKAWIGEKSAAIDLPAPSAPGRYTATFRLCPIYIRNIKQKQRISILLNGAVIGQFRTGIPIAPCLALPPELVEPGGTLHFTLVAPDGIPLQQFDPKLRGTVLSYVLDQVDISPVLPVALPLVAGRTDDVQPPTALAVSDRFLNDPLEALADAVQSQLGTGLPDILRVFESLGDNCSFGLAQQKGGSDAMALLRFANAPLASLLRALDDEFAAVRDGARLTMKWDGEFMITAPDYGIRWHTNVFDKDANQSDVFRQQVMRLGYLRRKFYEGLAASRKIWAISRAEPRKHPIPVPRADEKSFWEEASEPLRLAELLPLVQKLSGYGKNSLLYLTRCERGRRSGTVELLAPGVLRGYVDDFVISNNMSITDHSEWMRVAVNAWLLDKGAGNPSRGGPSA